MIRSWLSLFGAAWLAADARALGLGGASVGVACHPAMVAQGVPFNVSVWYVLDRPRPVDVHLDAVGAVTKEWFGGTRFSTNWSRANLTLTMILERGGDPILWKVFVTPYMEPFPNMLGESGFLAVVGDRVVGDCPYVAPRGTIEPGRGDYVVLENANDPPVWTTGTTRLVRASFGLVNTTGAEVIATLAHAFTEEVITTNKTRVSGASGEAAVSLAVPPRPFGREDDVYLVVLLVAPGGGWPDRLAQDRTYRVRFCP
ncbi:hypothetical protein EBZ80_12575 [bacterium]|nr:hypothetical protein [bacterium]